MSQELEISSRDSDGAYVRPVQFFSALQADDGYSRAETAVELCTQIRDWASDGDVQKKKQVVALLPSIMRLARSCPFSRVREHFASLEAYLSADAGIALPIACSSVSKFLPPSSIMPISSIDPNSPILPWFEDSFLMHGRVSHLDQIMALLPEFAEAYFQTFNFIMYQDGPLPLRWRSYLAIVASCRFQCEYLVHLQEEEFILNGGDPNWLRGIEFVPDKLRLFLTLNAYMAHRPWLINKAMISDMVKNGISLSELVHGIMIIAMFHALSGFVHGLGVVPEVDLGHINEIDESRRADHLHRAGDPQTPYSQNVHKQTTPNGSSAVPPPQQGSELTRNLKVLLQTNLDVLIAENAVEDPFEHAGSDETETSSSGHISPAGSGSSLARAKSSFAQYLGDVELDLEYADYDVKSTTYKVFRMQDYNWKDHGFSLVTRYYHGAANLLDAELDLIYNLTDRSLSEEQREIDTGPFRRAIWHYAHRLFGISNDAYNYQEVNIFLNRSIKNFIKKATCLSSTIEQRDFLNLGYHFRPDECAHITLLAVEGRRQSEILYALHALYALQKA